MSRVRAHRSGVRSVHLACLHKVYSNSMYKKGMTWPNNRLFFSSRVSVCIAQLTVPLARGPSARVQKRKTKKGYKKKERGAALSSTPAPGPRNLIVMECDKVGVKGQVRKCGGHRERVVAGEMLRTPHGGLSDAQGQGQKERQGPRKGWLGKASRG